METGRTEAGRVVRIIDAWAQHPTARHIGDPIFDSLRRWTGADKPAPDAEIPVSSTLAAMDAGHGRQKVLFGTNYPMIQPAAALKGLDSPGLSSEGGDLFLAGDADRVFGLR